MEIVHENNPQLQVWLDRINKAKTGVALLSMLKDVERLPVTGAGITLAPGENRKMRILAGPREAATHSLFRKLIALEGTKSAREWFYKWSSQLARDEMAEYLHYCDEVLDLECNVFSTQQKKRFGKGA